MVHIWLSHGTNRVHLPVVPETVELPAAITIARHDMAAIGEVALPGKRKLRTLTINSYFPARADGNTGRVSIIPPAQLVTLLTGWVESGAVVMVSVTGGALAVTLPMLIETFSPKMGKQAGDIQYELSLVEYRDLTARKASSTTYVLPGSVTTSLITTKPATVKPSAGSSGGSKTDVGRIGAYRAGIQAIGGIQAGPASKAVAAARTAREAAKAEANKPAVKPASRYAASTATKNQSFSPANLAKYGKRQAMEK